MKEVDLETQEEKLNKSSQPDESESFHALEAALKKGADNLILKESVRQNADGFREEADDDWPLEGSELDEFEEGDLLDEEYLRSEAYRRRARRQLSPEQREERRAERVAAFWDFIDTNRRQLRWVAIGIVVLIATAVAAVIIRNWTYREYEELVVSEKEDTISVSYADVNGKVLKYGVDGAMLVDQGNNMEWTISYDMNAPKLIRCETTFAIYDSKGTSICICNSNGQIGTVSTDLPIVKADVSRQGVIAAILEDGQNAWIRCYDKEGAEIATLKTTFTTPGYPVDLALSENGNLLAVDYLSLDNGTPVSRIAFYNFGTVGRNQKDNLVAETDYRDRIVPEVACMDESTYVVFGEKGFSVFTGSQIPVEDIKVEVSQSIVSTFHDSDYIGLVLQNRNPEKQYMICLYNRKGREILRKETDFKYETIEMNGEQIVLASRDEFCVYSVQGVEKYRGSLPVPASEFLGFGRNKFIYVSEDTFRIIRLG